MINEVYTELGFNVKFVELSAKRGLIELNKGRFDADLVRLKRNNTEFENITFIDPELKDIKLLLICHKSVVCNEQVLKLKKNTIETDTGLLNSLKAYEIVAKINHNERTDMTLQKLKHNRIQYAFYTAHRLSLAEIKNDFNAIVLKTIGTHHVVHNRHKPLIPAISEKLKLKIAFQ